MAPDHFFQIFLRVTVQNQIGIAQWVIVDEVVQLYNKPLEYAQMVRKGEMEHYLSLGCDHGRSENRPCTIRRKGRTRANESGLFRVFVGSCAKLW